MGKADRTSQVYLDLAGDDRNIPDVAIHQADQSGVNPDILALIVNAYPFTVGGLPSHPPNGIRIDARHYFGVKGGLTSAP